MLNIPCLTRDVEISPASPKTQIPFVCNQTKALWVYLCYLWPWHQCLRLMSSGRKAHVTRSASPCGAEALIQAWIKQGIWSGLLMSVTLWMKWNGVGMSYRRQTFSCEIWSIWHATENKRELSLPILRVPVQLLASTFVLWADNMEEFFYFLQCCVWHSSDCEVLLAESTSLSWFWILLD